MTSYKSSYKFAAQAETLLIYGIFLFLTGLAQISVTISHRYIIEKTIYNNNKINILTFFSFTFTTTDIHLWYIYPSAVLTIIPFLFCLTYVLFKRQITTIFICISSLISFISSSIYVGLLIIYTLDYWQTVSSYNVKPVLLTTSSTRILVPINEAATFSNLALLITFTLALVQALLSIIGAVISCLWSPCCMSSWSNYTQISTNSHYVQTTSHQYEIPQSSILNNVKRQHHLENHRFMTINGQQNTILNNFLHKTLPNPSHYNDV